jgi:hypothetical protein
MNLRAILGALYLEKLTDERERPKWLNAGDPQGSAKYRLALLVAAPVLFAYSAALAVFVTIFHPPMTKNTLGFLAALGFIVSNLGAYVYLGVNFDSVEPSDLFPAPLSRPSEQQLAVAYAVGYLSFFGYIVTFLWLALV